MSKLKRTLRVFAIAVFAAAVAVAIALGALIIFIYREINFEADERLFEGALSFEATTFYATDDEGEWQEVEQSGGMRKSYYPLEEISPYLKDGFIAVEDKTFYSHKGFDTRRSILAALNYISRRERVFGASTITQQVIKNMSGDNQMTLVRKISEIIRAAHIERIYTKDEILEVYLNLIPMSENIFGVGAAARAYFGKSPSELLPEEAATLIGITNAPTAYNPYSHPKSCSEKRNIVLSVMHADGVISDSDYERAKNTPLTVIPREEREDRFDSWFVEVATDEVCRDLAEKYDVSNQAARLMLLGGGYKVYTTMNIAVQSSLEEYFENTANFPSEVGLGLNYAMVVSDSQSGDLAGVVGRVGKKSGNRLLNHAAVPHTPGSVMKPLALYAPLIDEATINWASVFDDVPVSFTQTSEGYREYPYNSPRIYDGLTTVADAVRLSKNTVALRLSQLLTPRRIFNILRDGYGFSTLIEKERTSDGRTISDVASAPMALGQLGRGVTLLELVEAYGVFSGDGVKREMRSYTHLVDHKGRVVLENGQQQSRIMKSSTARIMNRLLMGVVEDGTAKGVSLSDMVETAGKTGTSGGSRDKFFVGYTPYYTAGIWCGFDSGERAVSGLSRSHLEIWDDIMCDIHRPLLDWGYARRFSTDGLLYLPYCRDSGNHFSEVCAYDPRGSRLQYGYFTPDNQPMGECHTHVLCLYDCESKGVATPLCPKENLLTVSLIRAPERSFPKEIYVSDAEFVYRDSSGYLSYPSDNRLPYFYYDLPPDSYSGISGDKKQFNSGCNIH